MQCTFAWVRADDIVEIKPPRCHLATPYIHRSIYCSRRVVWSVWIYPSIYTPIDLLLQTSQVSSGNGNASKFTGLYMESQLGRWRCICIFVGGHGSRTRVQIYIRANLDADSIRLEIWNGNENVNYFTCGILHGRILLGVFGASSWEHSNVTMYRNGKAGFSSIKLSSW
jgi:hypothetical protein